MASQRYFSTASSQSQIPLDGNEMPIPNSHEGPAFSPDFVSAVSVISTVYSRGRYLNFEDTDGNPKERELSLLGKGSVFVAYKREIHHKVPSQTQIGQFDTKCTPIVFKKPKTLFDASGRSLLPEEVQSFLMETQILSHRPLYWHPNIITLLGISWYLDLFSRTPAVQPQLVLEAADQPLDKFLRSSTDIPFQTRVRISLDITNGLSAVHACGIIHGDIKPANILLCSTSTRPDSTFRAKLADFSHSWVDDKVPCRRLVGSPKYRAPEIVRRERITDFRSADIFSLGATLWRVLVRDAELPVPLPRDHNLDAAESNDPYISSILGELRQYLQNDANESRWPLLQRIFRASLCLRPESRQLDSIQQAILLFLRTGPDSLDSEELALIMGLVDSIQPRILQEIPPDRVFINYQLFQRARGPVQDQMIKALQAICQDPTDVRRPRALYELGICNLASLGDPGKSNQEAALLHIFEAAEHGIIAARGYMNRLLNTLARGMNGQRTLLPELRAPTEWLIDAAVAGHEVAFEEFTLGGTHRENKEWILLLRASKRFHSVLAVDDLSRFQRLVGKIPESRLAERMIANDDRDTILHWASYRNLEQHLFYLVGDENDPILDVDVQNDYGDTPLITACSVGNLEAALCLIRAGANVNLVNTRNETCLHHLWRFTDNEGLALLHELLERGIDCEIETDRNIVPEAESPANLDDDRILMTAELDPLPVLPGKAIQRLAGRGRTTLLHEFLLVSPPTDPQDGNLIRQMIRWASTLTFPDTREVLLAYARGHRRTTQPQDPDLEWCSVQIEDATFEIEGIRRGYMDAVAQGWLSIRRDGWNTPDIWWRVCCHGPRWWERLQNSADAIIWSSSKALCCYEGTLLFALQNHSLAFSRLFLQRYTDRRTERRVRDRRHVTCTCDRNQSTASGTGGTRRLEPLRRPIDQIMYRDGRTLLHFTIMMGLRQAFLALVHEFNADTERLVEHHSSDDYPPHSLNCYALLAIHSKDGWFINELLNSGLDPNYSGPLQSLFNWRVFTPFSLWFASYYLYIPPLLHAFDHGCHFLVRFLLDRGASIEEPITPYSTVFNYILSPAIINRSTLRFLFSRKGYYPAENGVSKPISPSLLPERLFDEGNGLRIFELVYRQQQLRSEEPVSVLHQFSRVHLWRYPIDVYMDCIWKLCLHSVFSAYTIPFNFFFLPAVYLTETKENPYRMERQRAYRKEREIKALNSRPLGSRVIFSNEAQQDEIFFNQIWHELLQMFPNTQVTPHWHREGYGFHLSRSLLAMALIGNKHIGDGNIMCPGPWFLTTFTICHYTCWSDEAAEKWSQPDSIVLATTEHYAKAVPYHQPSLVNFFLCDDYDFVPSDSVIAKTLYDMGHRHSLLYFHEIRLVVALVFSTLPFIIFTLARLHYFSFTVGGAIIFYPSLILSLFEKPYIPFVPLNLALLVGWPFLAKTRIFVQPTLLFLFQLPVFLFAPFFIGSTLNMRRQGHFRSRERFLYNALRPGFRYAGYNPIRLFVARPRGRSVQLEDRTQPPV